MYVNVFRIGNFTLNSNILSNNTVRLNNIIFEL